MGFKLSISIFGYSRAKELLNYLLKLLVEAYKVKKGIAFSPI